MKTKFEFDAKSDDDFAAQCDRDELFAIVVWLALFFATLCTAGFIIVESLV